MNSEHHQPKSLELPPEEDLLKAHKLRIQITPETARRLKEARICSFVDMEKKLPAEDGPEKGIGWYKSRNTLLTHEVATLTVEKDKLLREQRNLRSFMTFNEGWSSHYILKALEASFDRWNRNRSHRMHRFRMVRNHMVTTSDNCFNFQAAILPCLVPPYEESISDDSSEFLEEFQPVDMVDHRLRTEYNYGMFPSIVIHVLVQRETSSEEITSKSKEDFDLRSVKTIMWILAAENDQNSLGCLSIYLVQSTSPEEIYQLLFWNPAAREDSRQIFPLSVEGITYPEMETSDEDSWPLNIHAIVRFVQTCLLAP